MYYAAAVYVVKLGHEAQATEWLRKLRTRTRAEPGNVSYLVHRSLTDPLRFLLYEQYQDEAAFDAHCAAPYFIEYVVQGLRTIIDDRQSDRYELLIGEFTARPTGRVARTAVVDSSAPKVRSAARKGSKGANHKETLITGDKVRGKRAKN